MVTDMRALARFSLVEWALEQIGKSRYGLALAKSLTKVRASAEPVASTAIVAFQNLNRPVEAPGELLKVAVPISEEARREAFFRRAKNR